jgi:hypothetical protein
MNVRDRIYALPDRVRLDQLNAAAWIAMHSLSREFPDESVMFDVVEATDDQLHVLIFFEGDRVEGRFIVLRDLLSG